ncbi:hypothetical protein F751_0002 [Auxenochlorella protothecoides]|uniref:Uncharacterized protein n=1 Tax=Auxenochlorella protothecoides TaxID=3075 RepID=A0A087S9M8_AUXPR|nr:hypothetical protein F751_0002 [Auxenochlorella protothecoides]KFM22432.1 hypothetical protein F751_0002 [Auxenochlorella protothecoides]
MERLPGHSQEEEGEEGEEGEEEGAAAAAAAAAARAGCAAYDHGRRRSRPLRVPHRRRPLRHLPRHPHGGGVRAAEAGWPGGCGCGAAAA